MLREDRVAGAPHLLRAPRPPGGDRSRCPTAAIPLPAGGGAAERRAPASPGEHFLARTVLFRGGGRRRKCCGAGAGAGAGGGPWAAPRWCVAAAGPRRARFRLSMATAAAGGAGQEKQLAPTLLSFFIYNPKLGPKEGEVPEGGVASRGCGERRAPSRPSSVPGCRRGPWGGCLGSAVPPRGLGRSMSPRDRRSPRGASPNKGGRWARSGASLGRGELQLSLPAAPGRPVSARSLCTGRLRRGQGRVPRTSGSVSASD